MTTSHFAPGNYRFIPAVFQYSSGAAADAGYEIERVRFGDRLRYDVQVADRLGAALVPRLALQTLVENSVKYAVSSRQAGASIRIRATDGGGRVRLEVEDDGPGFDTACTPDGHGLALVRSRLAMTFGDRASLRVESRPGRTLVTLDLPS